MSDVPTTAAYFIEFTVWFGNLSNWSRQEEIRTKPRKPGDHNFAEKETVGYRPEMIRWMCFFEQL